MNTTMKWASRIVVLSSLVMTLTACDGSSSSTRAVPPPPPPPPPPMQTSFNQFVQDQFVATADNTDPQLVDNEDFAFDEDATAFDNLLQ